MRENKENLPLDVEVGTLAVDRTSAIKAKRNIHASKSTCKYVFPAYCFRKVKRNKDLNFTDRNLRALFC